MLKDIILGIFGILFTTFPLRGCLYKDWDYETGGMEQKVIISA